MILADTSAWVEYLRGTGSPTCERMRGMIADEGPLATTEIVHLELLAGAGTPERSEELRRLLARFELLPIEGLADHEAAAELYRASRAAGATVRSLTDCLIAAVALRTGATVLHRDRDYAALAGVAPLTVESS